MAQDIERFVAWLRSAKRRMSVSDDDLLEMVWQVHPRFRFFKSLPWGANLVDLGAGEGGLVHWKRWLKPQRPDLNLYGVDLSAGAHKDLYAGWETINLDKERPDFPGVKLNGVVAGHLIEYLATPEVLIEWLASRSEVGGRMYFEWSGPAMLDLPTREQLLKFDIDVVTSNFRDDGGHKEAPDLANLRNSLTVAGLSVIASGAVDLGILGEEMFARGADRYTRSMGYWSMTRSSLYAIAVKSKATPSRPAADAGISGISADRSRRSALQPSAGTDGETLRIKRSLLVSGLFDPEFYRRTYADIQTSPVDPLTHYIVHGEAEGRSPNPVFFPAYYRRRWMAEAPATQNALAHYAEEGERLGHKPHPAFDPQVYLAANPPLAEFVDRPLFHYLRIGREAGLPVAAGPRGQVLARVLETQPYAAAFESLARHDTDQLKRYEQGLVQELGVEEGSALYQEMFASPDSGRGHTIDLRQWQIGISLESPPTPSTLERPIGIFVHLFYVDLAEEIARYLTLIAFPKKIYISTNSEQKKTEIHRIFELYGMSAAVQIVVVANYGLDIAPFLIEFRNNMQQHELCLKIHGKKSRHASRAFGEGWRTFLYDELIGDADRVRSIVHAMVVNRDLGVLVPNHYIEVLPHIGIGPNYELMQRVLAKIGLDFLPDQPIEYASGSMFWFRSDALLRVSELGLDWLDFGNRVDEKDGTLAHAIERCILFFCAHAGKKWAVLPANPASGRPSSAKL